MSGQHYCLRWNNYQSNMTSVFHQLLQNEAFVDVTLACNDLSLKAHKVSKRENQIKIELCLIFVKVYYFAFCHLKQKKFLIN